MKRVRLRSGWVLVQSEEGGGKPAMGTVCEMGGERRLGVGIERESIWGALFAKQVLREVARLWLVQLNEWDWGICWV